MLRLLVRFTLPLAFLLTMSILAVRARPFQSPAVQVFPQPGCAMPCFMGIQPGVTMGDEAIRLLQQNEWVDLSSIAIYEDTTRQFMWINWDWSDRSPTILRDTGYLIYSPQQDGRVRMMEIRTTIPVGDLKLLLGKPDEESVSQVGYAAYYREGGLFIRHVTVCRFFWDQTADLIFVSDTSFDRVRSEFAIMGPRRPISKDWGRLCH